MLPTDLEAFNDTDHYKFKICIIGKSSVGKTKLLIRYRLDTYEDSGVTTLAIDHIPIKKTINNKICKFDYYDTAGQQRFQSTVNLYLKNAHGIILVYSVNQLDTFEKLNFYYNKSKQMAPMSTIMILGNKLDLGNKINQQNLNKFKDLGIKCYKVSAKTGENVRQSFQEFQDDLIKTNPLQKLVSKPSVKILDTNHRNVKKSKQNSDCC